MFGETSQDGDRDRLGNLVQPCAALKAGSGVESEYEGEYLQLVGKRCFVWAYEGKGIGFSLGLASSANLATEILQVF